MTEPVIPDASREPEPSPAVVALRKEVALCQEIVFLIGNATIKAKEGFHAHEVMSYLDNLAASKVQQLDSLIASEILQAPVRVEGGSKLTLAESH